jgi:phosphoglycerate dehydrogenase-like enzyme
MRVLGITDPLDFSPEQSRELESIASEFGLVLRRAATGDGPISRDGWIEIVSGCNYVISGKQGMSARDGSGGAGTEGIYSAPPGTVISHPFVNVAWVDGGRLADGGITLLYAPGCNRDAVAEWVLGCSIALFRELRASLNMRGGDSRPTRSRSLAGKTAAVLGRGAVGARVGEVLGAMRMNVRYLERGGAPIPDVVRGADLVVNCLSSRTENGNLLGAEFFASHVPHGSVFVSMTNPAIYSIDGLLGALSAGRVRGAAIDVGNTFPGDTEQANYKRFTDFLDLHPQFEDVLLVTPQVAHFSDASQRSSFDVAIENIRAAAGGLLDQIPDRVWR